PASIAAAVGELTGARTWEETAVAGQEASQRFSWDASAAALVDLIRTVHAARR
ncbi:glycosyltransferase family 1 protein, partial [Burkholderia multivorans]